MGADMKLFKNIFLFFVVYSLTNCDPGLKGDLKIYNESNQTLTVKYLDYGTNDTVYKDISSNSNETIKVLSGLGDRKTFDCCPCQLKTISIKSTQGQIKRDPNNKDNWTIPNKSKLKKYGKEPIKCELHVTQDDI